MTQPAAADVIELDVRGMTCASCVARVERKLNKLDGVRATVDLVTESARVLKPAGITVAELVSAVNSAGYDASLRDARHQPAAKADERADDLRRRLVVATVLGVPVVGVSMVMPWHFPGWQWWAAAASAPIAWWCALPFHRVAVRQLRHGSSSMDTLVALGVAAAWLGSVYSLLRARAEGGHALHEAHVWFEVVAAVTAFLLLGRRLEHAATRESGAAIRALLQMQPDTARRVSASGEVTQLPAEFVVVGDHLLIKPGDRVPVDGVIASGVSEVDESMLTGESVPVAVGVGDGLTAGTVMLNGQVMMRATAVGASTRLAQISALVAEAHSRKSQTQRLADRISGVFVPLVLLLAGATAAGWLLAGQPQVAVTAAIAVLVVACPCALGLATPTAMLAGIGRGAQHGILISGPDVLERAAVVDTIVFDKTGTLTAGRLQVVAAAGVDDLAVWQWRALAGTAAASNHPVAAAVAAFATQLGHTADPVREAHEHPGAGVSAPSGAVSVRLGKPQWAGVADDRLSASVSEWEAAGLSVAALSLDGVVRAAFAIADTPRPESAEAVASARRLGLTPWLLTGDHVGVANRVAEQTGIDVAHVRSGVSPEGKQTLIEELHRSGHRVVMVGDGINDSAALASADIGIAMGAGTGAAIAAGDITLVASNIARAVPAIRLARRTLSTIKVNLFWAFAYNVVMIPLAAFAVLNPMVAGFAMAASSVLVVSNSLRLRATPLT